MGAEFSLAHHEAEDLRVVVSPRNSLQPPVSIGPGLETSACLREVA